MIDTLEEKIDKYIEEQFGHPWDGAVPVLASELYTMAKHFYNLALNDLSKDVYESCRSIDDCEGDYAEGRRLEQRLTLSFINILRQDESAR